MDAMPKNTANADNPAKSNMTQPRSIEGAKESAHSQDQWFFSVTHTLELSPAEVKLRHLAHALDTAPEKWWDKGPRT